MTVILANPVGEAKAAPGYPSGACSPATGDTPTSTACAAMASTPACWAWAVPSAKTRCASPCIGSTSRPGWTGSPAKSLAASPRRWACRGSSTSTSPSSPSTVIRRELKSATTRKNPVAPAMSTTATSSPTCASASVWKCVPAMNTPPPKVCLGFGHPLERQDRRLGHLIG
jgi:hypothetical protein